jgi:hypothetical protein
MARRVTRIIPARMTQRSKARSSTTVACPFCGEEEELSVDAGGGRQQTYTEDCPVCCRPRVVHVEPAGELGEVHVWLERGE